MIGVCPMCSKIDYEKIEKQFGEDNVEVGCLGQCEPFEDKVFGYLGDDFTVVDTEEEFIKLAEEYMNKK